MKRQIASSKTLLLLTVLSFLWLNPTVTDAEARVASPNTFAVDHSAAQVGLVCDHTIGINVSTADARAEYSGVKPGDTVCITAGNRGALRLKNFAGTSAQPIVFINNGGQVVINSTSYYGILIQNSQHLQVTGTGSTDQYGIKITRSSNHGVRIGWKSEYFEIDHLEITGTTNTGILTSTKAECSDGSTNDYDYDNDGQIKNDKDDVVNRKTFTQRGSIFHDNYIHNVGTEGFYIGSSYFEDPKTVQCASGSETVYDSVLKGVHLYNNIVENSGWDGLQVGSAVEDCTIHHNQIFADSQAMVRYQQSGIMNNDGSVCHIYNNFLKNGASRGIYLKGYGGNEVYNNIIINPGQLSTEDGIIVAGSSQNGGLAVINNTIINPSGYGINYRNDQGTDNLIENNIIVNPGSGQSNAINMSGDKNSVEIASNFITMKIDEAKFSDVGQDDYTPQADSPLVDAGASQAIGMDFTGGARPQGNGFDIGAIEYGNTLGNDNLPNDPTKNEDFYLDINVVQPAVFPGEVVEVKLNIKNAAELYGFQVTCQVDPAVLTLQDATFGDFFTNQLVGTNIVDAAAGTWTGALSQMNPAPALVGDGLYGSLTFVATASGETTITCEPLASDRDGLTQPILPTNDFVSVTDVSGVAGVIDGLLTYQGRFAHSNIQLTLNGLTNQTAQTGEDGSFTVNDLSNGTYTIQADANLYLPNCTTATAVDNQITSLQPTLLIGGDTNDDDVIKINDATLIGGNFGKSAAEMNPNADINSDGVVNVQDLSILGGNFGKSGCQDWEFVAEPGS